MKIDTTRFGLLEVDEATLLTVPEGIIGFPESTRYVILDSSRQPAFKWLQSVQEPHLAFVIVEPAVVKHDYRFAVGIEELTEIGAEGPEDLTVFIILTVPSPDPASITANLRGPVIVNARTRVAKQVVLHQEFPTRYPIFNGSSPPSLPGTPSGHLVSIA